MIHLLVLPFRPARSTAHQFVPHLVPHLLPRAQGRSQGRSQGRVLRCRHLHPVHHQVAPHDCRLPLCLKFRLKFRLPVHPTHPVVLIHQPSQKWVMMFVLITIRLLWLFDNMLKYAYVNNSLLLLYRLLARIMSSSLISSQETKRGMGIGILPRRTYVWIDDDSVDSCYACRKKFGWFLRKHHCRACGRIFCYECSQYNIYTSSPLTTHNGLLDPESYLVECRDHSKLRNNTNRSCHECTLIYRRIDRLAKLVGVFELISLDIAEYHQVRQVSQMWYEAGNIYLSRFREIQYNLVGHEYSHFERTVLRNNIYLLVGHNRLMTQLVKTLDWYRLSDSDLNHYLALVRSKDKTCSCRVLMCSPDCQIGYTDTDVLDLLNIPLHPRVREVILTYMTANDELLECYLPVLNYCMKFDKPDQKCLLLRDHLIARSLQSQRICYKFFWQLMVQIQDPNYSGLSNYIYQETLELLTRAIVDNLGESELIQIKNGMKFVNLISGVDVVGDSILNDLKTIDPYLKLPIDPTTRIDGVEVDQIKVMNSATRPIMVPCRVIKGDSKSKQKTLTVMYKSDDLRKDALISSIIRVMNCILWENNYDMNIVTYDILPTSIRSGLIQIVDDAETLYNINEKKNYSLQNYILENNGDYSVDSVRTRFVKSTAAYSVITYLLGIGDRHMDNIMVTRDGRLFHIDYSFVLGLDPKPLAPKMRITTEMIDALGGVHSHYYAQFELYCEEVYNILRRYSNLFCCMLSILTSIAPSQFTVEQLAKELSKRFLPGEYKSQAGLQLIRTIKSSQESSGSRLTDAIHYHYKESLNYDRLTQSARSLLTYITGSNGKNLKL